MFLSLVLFRLLTLILGTGHISFIVSDYRDKLCFFGTDFRVRVGSGQKVFLSLAQVSDSGCVSCTGTGFSVRVLRDWLVSCFS